MHLDTDRERDISQSIMSEATMRGAPMMRLVRAITSSAATGSQQGLSAWAPDRALITLITRT